MSDPLKAAIKKINFMARTALKLIDRVEELEAELEKAKEDKRLLDKLDGLAKFHGPRVNFYRTGPHMDGGTVVLQIMGQREVEGVDLRDAINGWKENR